MLSASRLLTPFILFGFDWSIEAKLMAVVILASTDIFDGMIARKVGNAEGIGKIIDSFSDKVMIFSVLIFLFVQRIVDHWVISLILLGEMIAFAIASAGIYLALKKYKKKGIKEVVGVITSGWRVSSVGKLAVVFYFIMAIFVFFRIFFPRSETLDLFYLLSFGAGFIMRLVSIGFYIADLYGWQKRYLTE